MEILKIILELIGIVILAFILLGAIGALAACMLSSRISQHIEAEEERKLRWNAGVELLKDLHELEQKNYTSSSKIVIPADLVKTIDDIERLR